MVCECDYEKQYNREGKMTKEKPKKILQSDVNIPYMTVPIWNDDDIVMEDVEELVNKYGTIKTEEV